ncbi:MAG: type II toxin-antitoxin system VapC family toxin [Hyphomonadaceae bacterium]|nr:type II toxin-antitoxin system VapC family toxin [Hyphomonadaceae bacterium]
MSAFVLDCSIAAAWCLEDEASAATDALMDRARDHGALAPMLWRWEIANALVMARRRQRVADAATQFALLSALPIHIDDESPARAWDATVALAASHRLSVYDAAYLEIAARTGLELATLDQALRDAAATAGVRVIP